MRGSDASGCAAAAPFSNSVSNVLRARAATPIIIGVPSALPPRAAICDLNPQEDLPLVEEARDQKNQGQREGRGGQAEIAAQNLAAVAGEEEMVGDGVEFDEFPEQVERDRVHADPEERPGPEAQAGDVDDQVEQAQEHRAVSAGDEDEGTR